MKSVMPAGMPGYTDAYFAYDTNLDKAREHLTASGIQNPTIDLTIEAGVAELEGIVKKLEEGDLPLETSLELYERGVQLSRFCHARLEEAERRIEVLDERGELKPAPGSLSDEPERS